MKSQSTVRTFDTFNDDTPGFEFSKPPFCGNCAGSLEDGGQQAAAALMLENLNLSE